MSIDDKLRKIEDVPGTIAGKLVRKIPTILKHGGAGILTAIDMRYGTGGITPIAPLDVLLGTTVIASGARAYKEGNDADGKPVSGAVKTGIYTALVNTATYVGTNYLLRLFGN